VAKCEHFLSGADIYDGGVEDVMLRLVIVMVSGIVIIVPEALWSVGEMYQLIINAFTDLDLSISQSFHQL